jgi:integrase
MASIARRRNRDGSSSWDATVRIVGHPTACKSFPTKLEADLWASRIEAAAKGRTLALAREMTVAQLIDEGTPKLIKPVAAAFAYWREQIGDLRLMMVTPQIIGAHRDMLLGAPTRGFKHKRVKPRSNATVRNYLVELSRLYTLAIRELRVCDVNPVAAVNKPPASRWRIRFLTEDERRRLLVACRASESPDLYLFVLMALTTGARKGELRGLHWREVDLQRRWAVFPRTKNGDARGVPLTQAVVDLLRARPRQPNDLDVLVFPRDMTRAWESAVARAGIADFRFHDCRHSAASLLVQSGANLSEVAVLLGHRGIQMTARYAHVANDHTSRLVDRVMGDLA